MSKEGKQSPASRWRQIRLAERRGRKRAERKHRRYEAGKWGGHVPKLNPFFKLKGKGRGTKRIDVPSSLDCDTPDAWGLLLRLLNDIRDATLSSSYKRVVLDFAHVTSLAPEAAVTIVAEIQRCRAFCAKRTQLTGTYPRSHDVAVLLKDVGFFKALGVKAPQVPASFMQRSYVQIERNNETVPEVAWKLLDCFSEVFAFDDEDRKRLHVALVESMDNVFEHAYPKRSDSPDLLREWWLAGYSDRSSSSICFIFYDQGAGIPTTIKARQSQRLLRMMSGWSDGKWIERALRKGMSRHDSRRRGHGLERLKEFIDRLDVEGSLRVVANAGSVVFPSNGRSMVYDVGGKLHGTLVVWQLSGVAISVPEGPDGNLNNAA